MQTLGRFKWLAVGLAMTLVAAAPARAAVVVGGSDGWEVSFDGTVNAFYVYSDANATGNAGDQTSRIQSGFLPSEFSFNVTAPKWNGMQGSARISFRPTIHTGKSHLTIDDANVGSSGISGATIDTREVFFNLTGPFGTMSFGRTLSLFGRQAIVRDHTLFGVGRLNYSSTADGSNMLDSGVVSVGRVGTGYTYPDFESRISYKTPTVNGSYLEIGIFDPSEPNGALAQTETPLPRVEGELFWGMSNDDGYLHAWGDGQWQQIKRTVNTRPTKTVWGLGAGAEVGINMARNDLLEIVGYAYYGRGLGDSLRFLSINILGDANGQGTPAKNYGGYGQVAYTLNKQTKLAGSWGTSRQSRSATLGYAGVNRNMAAAGVYHNVTSWMKVIGEYSYLRAKTQAAATGNTTTFAAHTVSVGTSFWW